MGDIREFFGENRFLSNFYPCTVKLDGISYPSVEHAYQAAKTIDHVDRFYISNLNRPGDAKRAGKMVKMRKDWESVKLSIMESLLRQKFAPGSRLAELLDSTGTSNLVEGNTWGDTFWGVCKGVGKNNLGKLLMKVRESNRAPVVQRIEQ